MQLGIRHLHEPAALNFTQSVYMFRLGDSIRWAVPRDTLAGWYEDPYFSLEIEKPSGREVEVACAGTEYTWTRSRSHHTHNNWFAAEFGLVDLVWFRERYVRSFRLKFLAIPVALSVTAGIRRHRVHTGNLLVARVQCDASGRIWSDQRKGASLLIRHLRRKKVQASPSLQKEEESVSATTLLTQHKSTSRTSIYRILDPEPLNDIDIWNKQNLYST